MGKKDKRVDAYISTSASFAKPILLHIRSIVHKACPNVEETMKWSFPHFDYHGMMCSMAAFKEHCVFSFWKASVMKDPHKIMNKTGAGDAMGHFGRITSVADLPEDSILLSYVMEAARLNDEGVKLEKKPRGPEKKLSVPSFFIASLKKNRRALATFNNFSPSHKREYVEWVTEARTDETRRRRMATTVDWLAEGKSRNWKYEKK